ncbi:MAG: hypothetical protein CM1200mP20_09560 [Pseudomonadota bacterium]|nr:MAG: hypothetical protein CM1200mP20_09560 [Pseudomonadota bacterium]
MSAILVTSKAMDHRPPDEALARPHSICLGVNFVQTPSECDNQSSSERSLMNELSQSFVVAIDLISTLDPDLVEIVSLSLQISLLAVTLAALIALPLGAAVAIYRFPGRTAVVVVLNAMMGLPPVVVGLLVYLLLSRAGPLGEYGLLFTPTAMVIANAFWSHQSLQR